MAVAVMLATANFAHATASRSPLAKSPTAKGAAAVFAKLGIGEGKPVTSPAKLNRQLHRMQMQLQAKAKQQARENRRRYQSNGYR
ncbi:hypothetical protein ACFQT0_10555 [Hymenobacter humi]|uniref:Uncharacterized protein n=1 Tax=Hymenobacter humi TaxID=1411620 RepID=A0ABW2U5Y1_9BACT